MPKLHINGTVKDKNRESYSYFGYLSSINHAIILEYCITIYYKRNFFLFPKERMNERESAFWMVDLGLADQ